MLLNAYNYSAIVSSRKVRPLLYCIATVCSILCIYLYKERPFKNNYDLYYNLLHAHPAKNGVCTIPKPDPWDASIESYLKPPALLDCKRMQASLTYLDDQGWLHFNKSAAIAEGYSNVLCQYRCFDRGSSDISNQKFKDSTDFREKVQPNCEFIEVSCSRKLLVNVPLYYNLHNQIIVQENELTSNLEDKPSVLLFLIDSVSRSNMIRNLPKLWKVLEEKYNSILFDGQTKVGDNSFPNGIAFLTGRGAYSVELPNRNIPKYFDNWPLIWNDFKEAGYATYHAEDWPEFNMFNYMESGFRSKPVDHYFRPFWVYLWQTFLHKRSSHLCFGNEPKLSLQLHYLRQFLVKYANRPTWALNWINEISHEWMNQVSTGDAELADFFTSMQPYLDNHFVFVFSDHGHRFDPIRQTVIGRTEGRMPFFTVSIPKKYREKFPELVSNVKHNSVDTLTSPYDLYVTMRDILSMTKNGDWSPEKQLDWSHVAPRGLSLLRPIPKNRTCKAAGIPEDFCICYEDIPVNITDQKVITAAHSLLSHINALLAEFNQCNQLKLLQIKNAQMSLPNMGTIKKHEAYLYFGANTPTGFFVNYMVSIQVAPSDAILEGTLRNDFNSDTFSVVGDVNRLNKYGNQSHCIKSLILRKYCYCKDLIT